MPIPVPKLEASTDRDDWVTIDEAVRITGESDRTWRFRASGEAEQAKSMGRQSLAMKAPTPSGVGRPGWWVHRSIDPRLSRHPTRETREAAARASLSIRYPAHLVDRALRKAHWLSVWRKACERNRDRNTTDLDLAERIVTESKTVEGKEFRISVRSLLRWHRSHQSQGIEGLIARYGDGDGGGSDTRTPEAVTYFYELYHTQNCLSIAVCHEVTVREAAKRGWNWPVSYQATVSWMGRHSDLSLDCLFRKGRDVWARKFLPHVQIDYTRIEPGYLYVCDHAQLDLWCTYKGRQIRPWLTAIEDSRSRTIVGWNLGPAPHQDAIIVSLRNAFRNYAIPSVMRIDNGKDFTSKPITGFTKRERDGLKRAFGAEWMKIAQRAETQIDCTDPRWLGITGELSINLIYSIPYSPWSKIIERFFKTLHGRHDVSYATYCGGSILHRPECLDAIKRGYTDDQKRRLRSQFGKEWRRHAVLKVVDQSAVPTLEEVRTRLGEWLDVYHRTPHLGQGMDRRTPLDVWRTATHLRKAVDNELTFLCDTRGLYTVRANGISLRVGSATLWYGAKSPALKSLIGRKVLIKLDPEDISHAWAFTPDRGRHQLIACLEPNQFIEPYTNADDAREAIAEKMRERSVMHKAARSAARRTKTACQRINEHTRAKRAELMATGTDDHHPQPRIVPVQTGFEGASIPDRNDLETVSYRPPESGDLDEMFGDDISFNVNDESDDEGMEDLFDDEPLTGHTDDGFGDL